MDSALLSYRECRDWHHDWKPYRAWKIRGGWEEQRLCATCGAVVIRLLDKNGYQVSRRIRYAEGYLHKGYGRLTDGDRAELRLAGVRELAKLERPSG